MNKEKGTYRIVRVFSEKAMEMEDENLAQSESIKNQKDFLMRYVLEQGWELVDVYVDDGFTGTNFDRPDFKGLLEDIEKGRVNLVITKDLSRLGRDYISTGYYIEKYFPEHSIGYIAVNDGIDTFHTNLGSDVTPFKSVINDMYARDISVKVRSAMGSKRLDGKFIGAFAPYGYKKNPEGKNQLIIDKDTAPVVRRIFQLYLNANGISKIAHILNEEGVITPTEYKSRISNYKGTIKNSLWSHNTIRCMLRNPTYTGCLTQNKYKRYTSRYCTRHSIKESELERMVLEDIKKLAAMAVDRGTLLDAVLFFVTYSVEVIEINYL